MQSINELEAFVSKLSDVEYAEFRDWFWKQDNEKWDDQIEKDVIDNKLANLANEALEDYKKGNFRKL